MSFYLSCFFFFNSTATTEIYTLSLHDALPILIVARHHDGGFVAERQIPESRQRLAIERELMNQICEQPLLLVGLRDADLVQVDPIGLYITGRRAVEQIIRADRRDAVTLLARPLRIALTGADDRAREIERERGG